MFKQMWAIGALSIGLVFGLSSCGDDANQFALTSGDPVEIAKQLESDAKLLEESLNGQAIGVVSGQAQVTSLVQQLIFSTAQYRIAVEQDSINLELSRSQFEQMKQDFENVKSALLNNANTQVVVQRMQQYITALDQRYNPGGSHVAWDSKRMKVLAAKLKQNAWDAYQSSSQMYRSSRSIQLRSLRYKLNILVAEADYLCEEIEKGSSRTKVRREMKHIQEALDEAFHAAQWSQHFYGNQTLLLLEETRATFNRMKRYFAGQGRHNGHINKHRGTRRNP